MYSRALQAYNSNTYVVRSYSLTTGPCMHVRMAGFKLCTDLLLPGSLFPCLLSLGLLSPCLLSVGLLSQVCSRQVCFAQVCYRHVSRHVSRHDPPPTPDHTPYARQVTPPTPSHAPYATYAPYARSHPICTNARSRPLITPLTPDHALDPPHAPDQAPPSFGYWCSLVCESQIACLDHASCGPRLLTTKFHGDRSFINNSQTLTHQHLWTLYTLSFKLLHVLPISIMLFK